MIKKNRTLTIIMLIGVVAIYGTILYKSIANKRMEAEQLANQGVDLNFSLVNYQKDDFEMDENINDPFRGKYLRAQPVTSQSNTAASPRNSVQTKPNPSPPKPVQKKWPTIQYFGFVKNTSSNNKGLCLLSVDGHLIKKERGDQHKGVTLISAYRDSVILSFDGNLRTFGKN